MLKDLEFFTQNSNGNVTISLNDKNQSYFFKLNNEQLILTLNPSEARYYFNILAMVLTFGNSYWDNLDYCGGTIDMRFEFREFINKNIVSISRDIKIEKIIE